MRQFELYIHGVPVGHDVCGSDKDLEYINSFYNHDDNISVQDILQIDVLNNESFYTYLHKKDVRNVEGRPGSYCAITISFKGEYCINVKILYDILDTIYKQVCTGSLITSDSHGELFLVREIASCMYKGRTIYDCVDTIIKNNLDSLHFKPLEGDYRRKSNVDYSLQEVDSPAFQEAMKCGRVLVSPEYGATLDKLNQLLSKQEPLVQQNISLKKDKEALVQQISELSEEIKSLRKQLSDSTSSFKQRYEKELQELKEKLKQSNEAKGILDEKIRKASDEIDLMEVPFQKLSRLMARRFRDEANDVRKEVRSSNTQPRTTNKEHLWIQGAIIILLLCVSAFSVFAFYSLSSNVKDTMKKLNSIAVTEETSVTEGDSASVVSTVASPEDTKEDSEASHYNSDIALETDHIDIAGFDEKKGAEKGKTYSLSIKRNNGNKSIIINDTRGIWKSRTDSEDFPGVSITNKDKFEVQQDAKSNTNVIIEYVVDGKTLISRWIKIK